MKSPKSVQSFQSHPDIAEQPSQPHLHARSDTHTQFGTVDLRWLSESYIFPHMHSPEAGLTDQQPDRLQVNPISGAFLMRVVVLCHSHSPINVFNVYLSALY